MSFRSVVADWLSFALFFAQPTDYPGAKAKTDNKRCYKRSAGTEGYVAEQVEKDEIVREGREQVIKQSGLLLGVNGIHIASGAFGDQRIVILGEKGKIFFRSGIADISENRRRFAAQRTVIAFHPC